jgi:hypothetical protein
VGLAMRNSLMGIKIIKEKKFEDVTFINDGLKLSKQQDMKTEAKNDKTEPD